PSLENPYVDALLNDLDQQLGWAEGRELVSIFFGGGTPSLFSGDAIQRILEGIQQRLRLAADCEITLESNPGSAEALKYDAYRHAGVNRLSIGVQSFNERHLSRLGRIHSGDEAIKAIALARSAGFDRLNIDLMYGLPDQTLEDGLEDIRTGIGHGIDHFSWYQLTIERNTAFWSAPPLLPTDDLIEPMQQKAEALFNAAGIAQYEVSAWSASGQRSIHNLNYWQFGDYLAIGAGAHGKVTDATGVHRFNRTRHPKHYLEQFATSLTTPHSPQLRTIEPLDLPAEFMMNALRLKEGVDATLFEERTALSREVVGQNLEEQRRRGLMEEDTTKLKATARGYQYLDTLIEAFV
ncbi:MAG: radical SAM family heme chaperone HemW, partial [Pseudomonadota bacterium]|nr:radical SAM family heme chaperone HemW [Pseudomonadota bacterium]